MSLSTQDVAKLLNDPSGKNRAETTEKIAGHFSNQEFSDSEKGIAEDIFRALVKDAEVLVREALSNTLRESPDLPRDVALSLAKDVNSVALPLLKSSEVLTDSDLISILKGDNKDKQIAIAQRPTVSEDVADAVIDTGNEGAVARLVSNEGAQIKEQSYKRVIKEYTDSESVSQSISRRTSLPASVAQELIASLSTQLKDYLVQHGSLTPDQASSLILQVRDRATVTLLQEGSSDKELQRLVKQLHDTRRLTDSLVLRALCNGDIRFFEFSLTQMSKLPLNNVQKLIHDPGGRGLRALMRKTNIRGLYFPVILAAVELIDDLDYDGELNDRARFSARLMERVLTKFELPDNELTPQDTEYLINKLEQLIA